MHDFEELTDRDRWNPAHFGEVPRKIEASGQVFVFWDDSGEPPDPDDFKTLQDFYEAWDRWEIEQSCKHQNLSKLK